MFERVFTVDITGLAGICCGVDGVVEIVEVDAVVVVDEFVEVDVAIEVDEFAAVFELAAVGLPVGKADLFFIDCGIVCEFSLASCPYLWLSILYIFPMYLSIFALTVYTTESIYFFILFFKIPHISLSGGSWFKL